jgi:hypothetical protein
MFEPTLAVPFGESNGLTDGIKHYDCVWHHLRLPCCDLRTQV